MMKQVLEDGIASESGINDRGPYLRLVPGKVVMVASKAHVSLMSKVKW